jgi:dolichol-phosphate mannosyltransferase
VAQTSISVIMPALNEEDNILSAITNTLQAFDSYGIQGEVLVINDGSTDKTRSLVEEFMTREPRVRLLNHDHPEGIGGSYWAGVDEARNDIVLMLPGDNENDPWEILRYLPLLEHVDIVIPFVFNRQVRSVFRNDLSFLYRFIINTTFQVNFNYTNGTVLHRRKVLQELEFRSRGFFFQTDILVRTVTKGYLFAEVPYRLNMRATGVSKAVSFPSFLNVARGYLRLVQDMHLKKHPKSPEAFAAGSMTAQRHHEKSRMQSGASDPAAQGSEKP